MPVAGIFISYRRSDNPDATGRIYDRLVAEFGKAQVFKDVDSIPLGQDFRGHLNTIVSQCGVMLAIVGPGWMDARDKTGQRRLDEPDDFVRIELEAALARDIPVVPVLVGHAPIPLASELPESLASMAFRQSINVRPDPDFHNDVTKLVGALRGILGPNAPRPEQPISAKAAASRSRLWMGAFAAAAIAAAALAYPAWQRLRETLPPELRVDIVTPATDDPESFALSPDGMKMVFVATSDGASRLWLRSLTKATALPLPGTEGAAHPFWSPDSKSVGFFTNDSLKRLDLDGGQPQTLAASTTLGRGSWGSNGVIMYSADVNQPLSRISASGGPITRLPFLSKEAVGDFYPLFLPDGKHLLFRSSTPTGRNGVGIEVSSLDGSAAVRLAATNQLPPSAKPLAFMRGWLLWIQPDSTLVAQRLDIGKGALVGQIVTLADNVSAVSTSASGVVAYRTSGGAMRQLTWVNRSGAQQGTVGQPDATLSEPRVSPNGRLVVFDKGATNKQDLWLQDDARASRMTFGGGNIQSPVWSPDSSRLAFVSLQDGSAAFYQKLITGELAQEQLFGSRDVGGLSSWSPDGQYLLFFRSGPELTLDLWVLPLVGPHKPLPFLQSPSRTVWGAFSPDGRWVAYESSESGRQEIYLRRFALPGEAPNQAARTAQWQVSTAGGAWPTWRADGKELYFIDPAGMMMAAPITVTGSSIAPGAPVALFQTNVSGGGIDNAQGKQYDVAKDGRFLINRTLNTGTAPITLIQNWNPEAKAKAN